MFSRKIYKTVLSGNKGFTLIEIAIVLILIGIIIGAAVKGKDLIRSANQKKVYNKFLNEWQQKYVTFYDRTGKLLGDTYSLATTAAGQDGKADTAAGVAGAATDAGRADLYDGPAAGTAYMGLKQVGIDVPVTNTAYNYTYQYTDSAGALHDLSVAFVYNATGKYNYMWITNCPNELGIAFDTVVDSSADGALGDFLCFKNDDTGSATAWGGVAGATLPTDEVSCRWKMQF